MSHPSIFDLFTIGIGPSSSHTVGPMRAACDFVEQLAKHPKRDEIARVFCQLHGSLAATGHGHATDSAIMLGFCGHLPESIDVEAKQHMLEQIAVTRSLQLPWGAQLAFDAAKDLDFSCHQPLALHPNGMHCMAFDAAGALLGEQVYYSLGGGFIATQQQLQQPQSAAAGKKIPFAYNNAEHLVYLCVQNNMSISELMLANELALRPQHEVAGRLDAIWQAMQECVKNGLSHTGILPGGLKVKRRARQLHEALLARGERVLCDPLTILDWVNLYALAVNEENAAGGRVVTAPTNGAAGVLPAVLHYATRFCHAAHKDGVHRFLLTAAAIAILYKKNASLSGADVGCQGEVGVACSMAAAALTEYLGGSVQQVENAAEIGMEHNLGLTCDPIGGLVQIPCIERNAMAAVKAINAARMALSGDGVHFVALDKVIATMLDTGRDMMSKYKETSQGGLAVNVVEC